MPETAVEHVQETRVRIKKAPRSTQPGGFTAKVSVYKLLAEELNLEPSDVKIQFI
jgi:hypothetical protein